MSPYGKLSWGQALLAIMSWYDDENAISFNIEFIESLLEQYEEKDYLSEGQKEAIENIVERFDIDITYYASN